jgi:excisionase family DNA binding protein
MNVKSTTPCKSQGATPAQSCGDHADSVPKPAGDPEKRLARILITEVRKELHRALRIQEAPDPLLTREEAAECLSVSVRTLDTLIAEGSLPALKIRGCVRIHPDALQAYIRRVAKEGARQ